MPRAIWSGTVGFGLVNVPVQLFSAVGEKNVKFKQINQKTGALVKQKRVDASDGSEVDFGDIVKGYELSADRFVVITPEELEGVAPDKSRAVTIEKFVPLAEIDPLMFDKHYYVGPAKGGAEAYGLLVGAMERGEVVAIGRIILRSKEKLCSIRAKDGVLILSTLVWANEINPTDGIAENDGKIPEASDAYVGMADQLVGSLTGHFDHAGYQDVFTTQVLAMIDAKAAGESVDVAPPIEDAGDAVPNLMAMLEASIEQNTKPEKAKPETTVEFEADAKVKA